MNEKKNNACEKLRILIINEIKNSVKNGKNQWLVLT